MQKILKLGKSQKNWFLGNLRWWNFDIFWGSMTPGPPKSFQTFGSTLSWVIEKSWKSQGIILKILVYTLT